jgi:hypothetical protein
VCICALVCMYVCVLLLLLLGMLEINRLESAELMTSMQVL